MRELCLSAGSSANSIVPVSFSYGPTCPNAWPPATTARLAIVTFVTSRARCPMGQTSAQTTNAEATIAFVHRIDDSSRSGDSRTTTPIRVPPARTPSSP